MRNTFATLWQLIETQLNLLGARTRDDRGAISTEMAVVMGIMVAVAVAAGIIFLAKAQDNANNIPVNSPG